MTRIGKLVLLLLLGLALVVIFRAGSKKEVDCEDISGYKNWVTSNRDILEKPLDGKAGYYTKSHLNVKSDNTDYSIFNVECRSGEPLDIKNVVLFYTEKGFSDTVLMDTFADVEKVDYFTGNGFSDIIVQMASGGNCLACEYVQIAGLGDNGVRLLTGNINKQEAGFAVKHIEDLDRDGKDELIVSDSTWQFAFDLCHACSPYTQRIFEWSGQEYIEAPAGKFAGYFERELFEAKQSFMAKGCDQVGGTPDPYQYCMGDAITTLTLYEKLRRTEEGWKFFSRFGDPKRHLDDTDSLESFKKTWNVLERQYTIGAPFSPDVAVAVGKATIPGTSTKILAAGYQGWDILKEGGSVLVVYKDDGDGLKQIYKFSPKLPPKGKYPNYGYPLLLESIWMIVSGQSVAIVTGWGETGANYFGTHPVVILYKDGKFKAVNFYKPEVISESGVEEMGNDRHKQFTVKNYFDQAESVTTILTEEMGVDVKNMTIDLNFARPDRCADCPYLKIPIRNLFGSGLDLSLSL